MNSVKGYEFANSLRNMGCIKSRDKMVCGTLKEKMMGRDAEDSYIRHDNGIPIGTSRENRLSSTCVY